MAAIFSIINNNIINPLKVRSTPSFLPPSLLPFINSPLFTHPSNQNPIFLSQTMASSDLSAESANPGAVTSISIEVMVAAVIFLFLVIVFVVFVYLYVKNYWGSSIRSNRQTQLIFADNDVPLESRGLDASFLRSLPVIVYNQRDFKEGMECSVCLCEFSDGEKARILPKCNHPFHLQCIDMWLHSHSTCPVCRCAVGFGDCDAEVLPESPVFPTNVLFWGNQEQVNSRSAGRNLAVTLPVASSGFASGNVKSPSEETRSPGASKLRSLRRLWSRGRRPGDSSCSSPVGGDVEQGFGILNGEGSSDVLGTSTSC